MRFRAVGRKVLVPIAGVAAVAAVMTAGPAGWARDSRSLLAIGQHLMSYGPATYQDEPRSFAINGVRLKLSAATTRRPMADVLDHFEGRCASKFTHREQDEDQGMGVVACVVPPESRDDKGSLADRLAAMARGSSFGPMRYVYAQRRDDHTDFLTVWSEEPLDVGRFFGDGADVGGDDLEGISRPPGARRVLSAAEVGKPFGVALYFDSPQSPEALTGWYKKDLAGRRWQIIEPASPFARSADDPYSVYAERDGVLGVIIIGRDSEGTTVTTLTGLAPNLPPLPRTF